MRIAVTFEKESWIIRRLAERFKEFAADDCEVIAVPTTEPVPNDVDVVLYADWPHFLQQPKAQREKFPGVLLVHHLDRFAFRLRLIAFQKNLCFCCMSSRWVSFLRRWTFPESKLNLIGFGVDMAVFQPAIGLRPTERVCIGVVGRLYPGGRKGEDRLLAIARLLPQQGFEFQFMGERWEDVSAELKGMGFPVVVAERCAESEQLAVYHRMDCLLVCSRNEGGPLPVLEALASGVPVISTDVGFLPELQEMLPSAVKIYESEDEAAKLLLRAKEMKKEAHGRSAEIRAQLEKYTWANWAAQVKKLLAETASLSKKVPRHEG